MAQESLPRKIVVGTTKHAFDDPYPGLNSRLAEIERLVDQVGETAASRSSGHGLDLVLLPEDAVTVGRNVSASERAVRLEGTVIDRMGAKARQYSTYLVVTLTLQEDERSGIYTNAAVLLDRTGGIVGIYRKMHPAWDAGSSCLEGGITPGWETPVFECDFGRVGIQICWDMCFPEGWKALKSGGAELVALLSASPQTCRPSAYALMNRYYVVSSTSKGNASVFNPIGLIEAQVPEGDVLIHQIDLSCAVLHWSAALDEGRLLSRRYGDRVGFVYCATEDTGVFWSNDPAVSIGQMIREAGLEEMDDLIERTRRTQDALRPRCQEGNATST